MRMFQARIWAAVAITAYLVTGCKAQDETSSTVRIAAILDTVNLPWAQEVWDLTTQVVQTNDWLKTVVPEFATMNVADIDLEFSLRNDACDPTTAVRQYWDLRENNIPPHALVGSYCSGASVSLARISGLENVPMLSPASTTSQLSDTAEFPFFSRIVAPDDIRGGVGAMVATLRKLGWSRVSLLATDLRYAQGMLFFSSAFRFSTRQLIPFSTPWTSKIGATNFAAFGKAKAMVKYRIPILSGSITKARLWKNRSSRL